MVRHASTAWNEQRRYQGWGDPPLSERGRTEAQRLGERLAGVQFDRVLTSDLRRSVETAALALPDADAETDPRLRELGFGAWDGLTYDECLARDGDRFRRWIDDPAAKPPPGGEAYAEFATRVDAATDALPRTGTALCITHGGPIRRIVAHALGLAWDRVVLMEVAATGITRLVLHPDGAHLLCWNDMGHGEGW